MDNVSYALCVIIKVIIHIRILQLAVCNLPQTNTPTSGYVCCTLRVVLKLAVDAYA